MPNKKPTKKQIEEGFIEFSRNIASLPIHVYIWGILLGIALSVTFWAIWEVFHAK